MRYAIYYTPAEDEDLGDLGQRWLGRANGSEHPLPAPAIDGIAPGELSAMTESPRRYGFHATLKPPFHLVGADEEELSGAVAAFAAATSPVVLEGLVPARLGPFLALVPAAPSSGLDVLAGRIVSDLDRFRAPPEPAETMRRRAAGLTVRQEMLLARWGYPYVMEEFRFHMTLTGPLQPSELDRAEAAAQRFFSGVAGRPLAIDQIAIFVEPSLGAPFRLRRRFALEGKAA